MSNFYNVQDAGFADPGREIVENMPKIIGYAQLIQRPDFFKIKNINKKQISLTDEGLALDLAKNTNTGAIDVTADVPAVKGTFHGATR